MQWLEVSEEINHYIIYILLVTVTVVFFKVCFIQLSHKTFKLNRRQAGHLAVSSEQ